MGKERQIKFDPASIPASGSFQQVREDGTARMPPETFDNPPPAQPTQVTQPPGPMPGVSGDMPLPVGHAVSAASLTPTERAQLEALGWKEGEAIPGNLPQLLAGVQNQATAAATDMSAMPPPGDPSKYPALQMPAEQKLEDMNEPDQARIRAALDEAQQIKDAGPNHFQPASEGVGQAAQGVVHRQVDMNEPVVKDDRQADTYSSGEVKHQHPLPDATAPTSESTSRTASPVGGPKQCPHCSWDLSLPDNVEPSVAEKRTFLQAILGGKPWQRAVKMMDGQLTITIRQLTPKEVDACYTQVFAERDRGDITNQLDFWEQLNRYRASLQLVDMRSGEDVSTFPDSLEGWG